MQFHCKKNFYSIDFVRNKFIIIIFFISKLVSAQNDTLPEFFIPNTAFNVGEILKYDLKYGVVKGGEATMVVDLVPVGYSYTYHFKTRLVTTGVAEKLAVVIDLYESYVEVETKLPIKAIRNVRENNYISYNEAIFDRNKNRIISIKSGIIDSIPENLMDIVSVFYYARNALFKYGKEQKSIPMQLYFDEEIYPLTIHYIKDEIIKSEFGKIETLLFMPIVEKGSVFANEEELKIWISKDENYIPLKIWAKLPIGTLKIELKEYQELRNTLLTQKQIKQDKKESKKLRRRKNRNNEAE